MAIQMQQHFAHTLYYRFAVMCTCLVLFIRRGKLGENVDKLELLIVLMLVFVYFH
jgi:hypothetical protein